MKLRQLSVVCFVLPLVCFAQSTGSNSNYWPVHRDVQMGFRISYPPGSLFHQKVRTHASLSVHATDLETAM
jgi:hypothetical protein